jgi:polysaccharide biosynthesis transport protein
MSRKQKKKAVSFTLPALGSFVGRWRRLRHRLRTRALFVTGVVVLSALLAGWLGYRTGSVQYRAAGLLSVAPPALESALAEPVTGERTAIPLSTLVQAQLSLLRNPALIDAAQKQASWQQTVNTAGRSPESFKNALTIEPITDAEGVINVSFDDVNPQIAQAGVASIIQAHMDAQAQRLTPRDRSYLNRLSADRKTLDQEAQAISTKIAALVTRHGNESLDDVLKSKQTIVQRLELALRDVQASKDTSPPSSATGTQTTVGASAGSSAARAQAAPTVDSIQLRYMQERRELQAQIDSRRFTLGSEHPWMADAKRRLTILDDAITNRSKLPDIIAPATVGTAATAAAPATAATATKTTDPLTADLTRAVAGQSQAQREKRLTDLLNAAQAAASQTAADNLALKDLRSNLEQTKRRMARINDEVRRQLTTNDAIGVARVEQAPALPQSPVIDNRPALASIGALTGGLLGLSVMFIAAWLDKRVRTIDDIRALWPRVAVLGSVPVLAKGSQSANSAQAVVAVHRLRSVLEAIAGMERHKAFAVTSADVGSGKTSIAVALGASLARSGTRTLVIDCDLSGGSLRRQQALLAQNSNLARAKQRFLPAAGVPAPEQPTQSFSDALVVHGAMKEEETQMMAINAVEQTGLVGYMAGMPLRSCVRPTRVPNLSIMPSIGAQASDLASLSLVRMVQLLDAARAEYDMVLIDTGPVPASGEATLAAAAADGVVLTVAPEHEQAQVQAAMDHLQLTQSRLLGVVLNRDPGMPVLAAEPQDDTHTDRAARDFWGAAAPSPRRGTFDPEAENSGILANALEKAENDARS